MVRRLALQGPTVVIPTETSDSRAPLSLTSCHKQSKWRLLLSKILFGCLTVNGEETEKAKLHYKITNDTTMGSSNRSSRAATPEAKTKNKKHQRQVLGESIPTAVMEALAKIKQNDRRRRRRDAVYEDTDASIFDDFTELDRMKAFAYFYQHPEDLPERESRAMKEASKKPKRIKVEFDLGIWERETPLRKAREDELIDNVDPRTIVSLDGTVEEKPVGEGIALRPFGWMRCRSV